MALVRWLVILGVVLDFCACKNSQVNKIKTDLTPVVGSSCADATHITLPIDASSSQTFSYSYLYSPGTAKSASQPTVIALPGGPGSSNIARLKDTRGFLPEEFNLLLIDARGTGCNAGTTLLPSQYSSSLHAGDVAAVIAAERAQRHIGQVILLGHSYGTVTATLLGPMLPPEKTIAIVLEGTLGRAFQYGERYEVYIKRWNKMIDDHPALTDILAGPDGDTIGSRIYKVMRGAPIAWFDREINDIIKNSGKSGPESQSSLYLWATSSVDASVPSDAPKPHLGLTDAPGFAEIVNCRELHGFKDEMIPDKQFKMSVVPATTDDCSKIGSLDQPYDSHKTKLANPIYYVHGTEDAATPLKMMQYHRDGQKSSGVQISALILNDHAHDISGDAALWPCLKQLWRSIALRKSFEFQGNDTEFQNTFCATKTTAQDRAPTSTSSSGTAADGTKISTDISCPGNRYCRDGWGWLNDGDGGCSASSSSWKAEFKGCSCACG